jgi:hypothetical protein
MLEEFRTMNESDYCSVNAKVISDILAQRGVTATLTS